MNYDYKVLSINTAALTTEREYNIEGEIIFIVSGSASFNVRLDSNVNDQIPLSANKGIEASFKKFYLSLASGSGTAKIYVSSSRDLKFIGNELNITSIADITNVQSVAKLVKPPLANNILSGKVTITDSITTIIGAGNEVEAEVVIIQNTGLSTVYISHSNSTLSTTAGIPVYPDEYMPITLNRYKYLLYGICESGESTTIRITRTPLATS